MRQSVRLRTPPSENRTQGLTPTTQNHGPFKTVYRSSVLLVAVGVVGINIDLSLAIAESLAVDAVAAIQVAGKVGVGEIRPVLLVKALGSFHLLFGDV